MHCILEKLHAVEPSIYLSAVTYMMSSYYVLHAVEPSIYLLAVTYMMSSYYVLHAVEPSESVTGSYGYVSLASCSRMSRFIVAYVALHNYACLAASPSPHM